jgi:hypothetical protein
MPSASAINLGQQLASSILSGGSASVPGTFVFSSRFASPNPGPASQSVTFIPTDIANYKAVTFLVPVTVYDGIVSPLNIALIPPPRFHMIRYHGVLSSHAKVRAEMVPHVEELPVQLPLFAQQYGSADRNLDVLAPEPRRKPWAWLLRHVFEIDVSTCPYPALAKAVRGDGGSTLSAQRDERTLLERHSGFGREAQARVAEPGLLSDGITIFFGGVLYNL